MMILALIPAYNEAEHIGPVVKQATSYLPVLVVDDGSSDQTAKIAEANGATVLRQTPNRGKGAALIAGFRWTLEHNYQAVVTLDADGQHDPYEIPQFLQAHQHTRSDLIIGARQFEQMPLVRRLANSLGQKAFSWALGQPVRDNQSGYRLISQRLLQAMLFSQEAGFQFEVEMIVTCVKCGFDLAWVPIRTIYAGESSHICPLKHTIDFSYMVWKTRVCMRKK
ncbi:MAG: glycosyltransferase family 2 protein [Anaerolineae bacterium]|nr:glycosyltransferase family 2 protein [Anaerolineae bacterium]